MIKNEYSIIYKVSIPAISIATFILFFVFSSQITKAQSSDIIYPFPIIVDGDLIKTADSPDIYIVKIVNEETRYKRLILNPAIFESYGHLEWDDVRTVTNATMNSFIPTSLVREVNADGSMVDGRVFMVFEDGDIGIKRHLQLTQTKFIEGGGKDEAIYNINHLEASETFYSTGSPITTYTELRALLDFSIKEADRIRSEVSTTLPLPQPSYETVIPQEPQPRASVLFTKQTLQPTTILPGSKKEVLTINALVSDRPITIRTMKVALSPVTGRDTALENTFSQIQVTLNGGVIAVKNIDSSTDYEIESSYSMITFDDLFFSIETEDLVSIGVHLLTREPLGEALLKDWNIVLNNEDIYAVDTSGGEYYINHSIVQNFLIKTTEISRAPSAPTIRNFRAREILKTSLTFEWDEFRNATGYEIDYCEGISCTDFANKQTISSGTEATISGLSEGAVYKVRVRATLQNDKFSPYKTALQGTLISSPVPSFGIGIFSDDSNPSLTLTWEQSPNAEGYVIEYCKRTSQTTECTDYEVAKVIDDVSVTSATIENLEPSSIYQFRMKATNSYPKVDSEYSDPLLGATNFLPPDNFAVTDRRKDSISLVWDEVPMGDGYIINYCYGTDCNFDNDVRIASAGTTTKQITLSANRVYKFNIVTVSAIKGNSSPSDSLVTRTRLSSPTLTETSKTSNSATLSWNAINGSGYVIDYCEGVDCTPDETITVIISGKETISKEITGLSANTTYRFQIKATGASEGMESLYSGLLAVTTDSS